MKANRFAQLRDDNHGQVAMIGVVIALAVSIVIGVLVFYKINASITTSGFVGPSNVVAAGVSYNATRSAINSSAQTTFTLLPIIAIILIAAFMIGLVTRFGQG